MSNHEILNVGPEEGKRLLDAKEDMGLFVLNVHTPYEGEVEKTDAFIEDWENIAAHAGQLPSDKHTPLFVYCKTGRMSSSAAEQLKALGYKNIYHLEGGMNAWSAKGFSIEQQR